MKIGGLQRFSLIDFPGKISAVLFTQGCPFRCHFCHNPSLVLPQKFESPLETEEVHSFLNMRKNQLQGVVISGGEPTIQPDIEDFIIRVKNLGYAIKLDSSGISPDVLENLLKKNLLDYVAMDIKAPLEKYGLITNTTVDTSKIAKSIELLQNSDIDFEFRSTILPALHTKEDLLSMGKLINGAPLYVLQTFLPDHTLTSSFQEKSSFKQEEMEEFKELLKPFVKSCQIR